MDNHQLVALALRTGASLAGIANADALRGEGQIWQSCTQSCLDWLESIIVTQDHEPGTIGA